ncbi:MAG: response regulator [Fibrobacteria bacterium]
MFKILVVDDEAPIRDMLSDALRIFGYEADTAPDGPSALMKLKVERFDMILSDINMPHMTGFELLRRVEEAHPEIKRVLMTAYNLDDYMRMVRDHNVGNVITKTVPLNFKEIREIINSLLNNAIFGLEQYMLEPHSVQTFKLVEPSQIDEISESLSEHYSGTPTHNKFKVVLIELMTNALFYGARNEAGDKKQEWVKDFRLADEDAVIVTACHDKEKLGVSVLDGGGKLDKHTVLYWLDRQTTHDEKGLPMGIFDYHGRGFFITRKYVDRFIINIEKGKRCECCIFNYFEEKYAGNKPLIINEI